MRTKNAAQITPAERRHLERIKSMPCGVCGAAGLSEAHHQRQGDHWTVLPLCHDCHQGWTNGLHGHRSIWKVRKLDELAVMSETIRRLMTDATPG